MNVNLWQLICGHLSQQKLLELRVLCKKLQPITETALRHKTIIINESNIADIALYCYHCFEVQMIIINDTYYGIGDIKDKFDESVDLRIDRYEFDYLHTRYDPSAIEVLTDTQLRNIGESKTLFYLEYPLTIYNKMGINYDTRGVVNPDLEFGNWSGEEKWKIGFYNIQYFIQKLWKLKSHKFENWYELMVGIYRSRQCSHRFCNCPTLASYLVNGELIADVSGDHGS